LFLNRYFRTRVHFDHCRRMKLCYVLAVLALCSAAFALRHKDDALIFTKDFVDEINSKQDLWIATDDQGSFFDKAVFNNRMAKQLLGVKFNTPTLPRKTFDNPKAPPPSFSAATHWPQCPTITMIRDQSACGSCWAFGAVEAMSDRYCTVLGSQGSQYQNLSLSAAWLMSCCSECGDGCDGGYPSAAWEYWVSPGIPTEACDPYPFPKCEHHIPANHYPPCPTTEYNTPACNSTCTAGSKPTFYNGKSAYTLSGVTDFQNEIMTNGPIEVAFSVYQDFLTYKSGVYKHVSGSFLGGHAVKMIGWGESNGVKYWVINNSWNADWGMNGVFWILRGADECGIEDNGSAGLPQTFSW